MAYPHEQIPMQQKQPFLVQQPGPTLGMQMGGGGNRNAAGKPLNSSGEREWSNGLCGCFEECGTCCYALWCPCVVHGKNKQRLDHLNNKGFPHPDGGDCCSGSCWGHCCLSGLGFGWLLQCFNRGDARRRYHIEGGGCGDCCATFCCALCDLVQVSREIELEENSFGPKY